MKTNQTLPDLQPKILHLRMCYVTLKKDLRQEGLYDQIQEDFERVQALNTQLCDAILEAASKEPLLA